VCFTKKFELEHPEAIEKDIITLKNKFDNQLKKYGKN